MLGEHIDSGGERHDESPFCRGDLDALSTAIVVDDADEPWMKTLAGRLNKHPDFLAAQNGDFVRQLEPLLRLFNMPKHLHHVETHLPKRKKFLMSLAEPEVQEMLSGKDHCNQRLVLLDSMQGIKKGMGVIAITEVKEKFHKVFIDLKDLSCDKKTQVNLFRRQFACTCCIALEDFQCLHNHTGKTGCSSLGQCLNGNARRLESLIPKGETL